MNTNISKNVDKYKANETLPAFGWNDSIEGCICKSVAVKEMPVCDIGVLLIDVFGTEKGEITEVTALLVENESVEL